MVTDADKGSLLTVGGDVDALCGQIQKFLALPNAERKSMGEKVREYIKANFSRKIVTKAYLEKINSLCKQRMVSYV